MSLWALLGYSSIVGLCPPDSDDHPISLRTVLGL
jgi:hypothetical protein